MKMIKKLEKITDSDLSKSVIIIEIMFIVACVLFLVGISLPLTLIDLNSSKSVATLIVACILGLIGASLLVFLLFFLGRQVLRDMERSGAIIGAKPAGDVTTDAPPPKILEEDTTDTSKQEKKEDKE